MRGTVSFAASGILAAVVSLGAAQGAEFKNFTTKEHRVLISMAGEIVEGDGDRFAEAIKKANSGGNYVANIRLNSPGGNLGEGVKLAKAIQYAKIATNVGKNGVCASACFLMFAAGATKYANYSARIGVHGAATKDGQEAGDATVSMARIATDFGVPSAIVGRMVVTAPADMVWLSPQELQSMGTTMVGKPDQTAPLSQTPAEAKAPMQLDPNLKASSGSSSKPNSDQTWSKMVSVAISISSRQNNGRAITPRKCEPKLKICSTAIVYRNEKGEDVMLVRRSDVDNNLIEREICFFNSFGDTRSCMNWDTQITHKDMKDGQGNWSKVAD